MACGWARQQTELQSWVTRGGSVTGCGLSWATWRTAVVQRAGVVVETRWRAAVTADSRLSLEAQVHGGKRMVMSLFMG